MRFIVSGITVLRKALLTLFLALCSIANANAEWREDIGVFRIGIVTQGDTTGTLARAEPFRGAVAEALDMDVEFFPASSVNAVMDALRDDRIEYAMLSASGYSLINSICECVEPIAIPRASDSTDAYHLIAITRFGENLSLQQLVDANVAVLSGSSILSAQLIRFLLTRDQPSLNLDQLEFKSERTSQETEAAFLAGKYDVLFGWSSLNGEPAEGFGRGTLRRLVSDSRSDGIAYDVLWTSPSIPHRPHVIRKKLPGEAKSLLRDLLTNLFDRNPIAYDSIEPIYGGGFSSTRSDRFQVLDEFFLSQKEKEAVEEPPQVLEDNG